MKAVVFHGIGDIRLEDVAAPKLQDPTDAIVRITATAICGTDLHLIRGTVPGMRPGTVLGHEGVGIVLEVGSGVRNFKAGDRVVIASTIACGTCSYCRDGYHSQCDFANPKGRRRAPHFSAGRSRRERSGLQAEMARVPFANVGLVKLPDEISDAQAIFLSDIFPTGYFGAVSAEVEPGDTVAVFGCGPVGQFAIASAKLLGAGRILAVDTVASRLEMARDQGAEVIDFNVEDPVEMIHELTRGIGVGQVIDAVGVDAEPPKSGPAAKKLRDQQEKFQEELREIAPDANPSRDAWKTGRGTLARPAMAVESLAKAGTLAIIASIRNGTRFPIGKAAARTSRCNGHCNHRKYIPELIEMVRSDMIDPSES